MQIVKSFLNSPFYWLLMAVAALMAEIIALYYQYVLDDYPCVVCIHIRLWVAAFLLLGVAGLWLRKTKAGLLIAQVLSVVFSLGFLERSYVLYGTENGFISGSCSISLGFPEWFAVDQWMPWLFKVEGACGFTPDVLFGITMAESLLAASIFAVAITVLSLILTAINFKSSR